MKNILIIGSTGQIGSELTMKLRGIYSGNVVAGYIPGAEPKGELAESGPSEIVDITNAQQIAHLSYPHYPCVFGCTLVFGYFKIASEKTSGDDITFFNILYLIFPVTGKVLT